MLNYLERRQQLDQRMAEVDVDLVFLPDSTDLEYLTGLRRRLPTFGNVEYAHSWATGCLLPRGGEPMFILPRMMSEFDLPAGLAGEVTIVRERDDAAAVFRRLLRQYGPVRKLAVGARTLAETTLRLHAELPDAEIVTATQLIGPMRRVKSPEELKVMARASRIADETMAIVSPHVIPGTTELELARDVEFTMRAKGAAAPSFDTGVWSMGPGIPRDASTRLSTGQIQSGTAVSFDYGAFLDGYASDFGRTIHVGEPSAEYRHVYEVVIEAQEAGIRAARPGVAASQVDAATRSVIVEAGLGGWFRHRTGHSIGMDVHERPFISEEDDTPLEVGMTFTVEPSVFRPGHYGVRIEDVVVCEQDGGRKLNSYPAALVASDESAALPMGHSPTPE